VQALDLLLGTNDASRALELHRIAGSNASENDFVPSEKTIDPGSVEAFAPRGGKSSSGTFPFFTLRFGNDNLITAIGWTGQWAASIDRDPSGSTRIRAGMELTHLRLHPGNPFRTPRILLLWKTADRMDAQNLFRRLILAPLRAAHRRPTAESGHRRAELQPFLPPPHLQPVVDRSRPDPGRPHQPGGGGRHAVDRRRLDGLPYGRRDLAASTGRLSTGLRPVGEACHQSGLRFLLWYEPERVSSTSVIAHEHPEIRPTPRRHPNAQYYGLFNLGDPRRGVG